MRMNRIYTIRIILLGFANLFTVNECNFLIAKNIILVVARDLREHW